MSLLRWLAATRSINSVHDKPSPYRMLQPNLLPKFGNNPARGRTRAQEDRFEPKNEERKEPAKEHENNAPQPEQKNENVPVAELVHAKAIETKERAWMFWRKWARGKRMKVVPVQTELDLDTVQVMRNDLSDSDLEVVMKAKGKKTDRLAGTVAAEERRGVDTAAYREKADSKFGI